MPISWLEIESDSAGSNANFSVDKKSFYRDHLTQFSAIFVEMPRRKKSSSLSVKIIHRYRLMFIQTKSAQMNPSNL